MILQYSIFSFINITTVSFNETVVLQCCQALREPVISYQPVPIQLTVSV